MTNNQKWATIIMSFILAVCITLGGYAYGSIRSVEHILSSPATTSKIDIDADMSFEMSENGELQLKYIHLNRIQAELNSKIVDLIILALNSD